jgi:hypothetical protein
MTAVAPRPVVSRPYPVRRQIRGSLIARVLRTTDGPLTEESHGGATYQEDQSDTR